MGLSQDKLGVLLGLDEQTASTRISRYENGIHEPPLKTAQSIATTLGVPLAYLYCDDNRLAELILQCSKFTEDHWRSLDSFIQSRLVFCRGLPQSWHALSQKINA